jgi:hypothetical protein
VIRRTWLGVGVVAISLVASGPVLAQQSGFRADADFLSSLSDCLESEVHVFVRGGTNGGGKIEASVVQIDHCQGETLLDARAEANLAAGALTLNGRDVTLATTVQMVDAVTNNAISMDFDLQWVGGERIVASTGAVLDSPGRFVRADRPSRRTLLLAQASGSISSGTDDYIDGPTDEAAIVLAR